MLDQELKDLDGEPIMLYGKPATLRHVLVAAMRVQVPGICEDQLERYALAVKLMREEDRVDAISTEEYKLTKKWLHIVFPSPEVVGRTLEALNAVQ